MDHETATSGRLAERYVAGELTDAEREQFEAHFFDCPACAEEVRCEQEFAANLRAVLRR